MNVNKCILKQMYLNDYKINAFKKFISKFVLKDAYQRMSARHYFHPERIPDAKVLQPIMQ